MNIALHFIYNVMYAFTKHSLPTKIDTNQSKTNGNSQTGCFITN